MIEGATLKRFWAKVKKTDTCWLWTGAHSVGYGHFSVNGVRRGAHRISYELACGPIPDGMQVLHACDVRECVNPNHLFVGTQTDNMRDASAKGRMAHGESHHNAKLDDTKVSEIRVLFDTGSVRQYELAKMYAVSKRAIAFVTKRQTWRHA